MVEIVLHSGGRTPGEPREDPQFVVKTVGRHELRVRFLGAAVDVAAPTMASLVPELLRFDDRACVFTDYLKREDITRQEVAVARDRVAGLEQSGVLRPGLKVEVDGRTYEVPRFILDVDPLQGRFLTINSAQVVTYDRGKHVREPPLPWNSPLGGLLIRLALASMRGRAGIVVTGVSKDNRRRLGRLLPEGIRLEAASKDGRKHINARLSAPITVAAPLKRLVRAR